jgi:hypothetical protein
MKTLLKIVVAILILAGIAVAVLLANINPIIEKLRPQIVSKITEVVKQPVELGKFDVSIFPNPGIEISDVTIQDGTSKQAAARVRSLFLKTGLSGLLKGKVTVNTLSISDALVSVKKRKDGGIYLGDFPLTPTEGKKNTKVAAENSKDSTVKSTQPKDSPKNEKSDASVNFKVENISIDGLTLKWEDNSVNPPAQLAFSDIDVAASNIGTSSTGTFKMNGSLLGTSDDNFKVDGKISLGEKTAGIPKSDVNLDFSSIDLVAIQNLMKSYGVVIEGLSMSETMKIAVSASTGNDGILIQPQIDMGGAKFIMGDLVSKDASVPLSFQAKARPGLLGNVTAPEVTINLAGETLSLPLEHSPSTGSKIKIKSESFALAPLGKLSPMVSTYALGGTLVPNIDIVAPKQKKKSLIPVNISGKVEFKDIQAKLPDSGGEGFKNINGTIGFSEDTIDIKPLNIFGGGGFVTLVMKGADGVGANLELKNMILGDISNAMIGKAAYGITGNLEQVTAKIATSASNPVPKLVGKTSMTLKDGELIGFNIFGETIKQLTGIPGLGASFASFIPEKYAFLLTGEGTKFNSIELDAGIANSQADITKFLLRYTAYTIRGDGWAKFDGKFKLKTQLVLAPELGEEMALKEPKLAYLQESDKSIVIPVIIMQEGSTPLVLPDVEQLATRAAKAGAVEAGKKALDKVAPGLGEASEGIGNALKSLF